MRTLGILEKCYGPYAYRGLNKISHHLTKLCETLEVEVHLLEFGTRGWVKIVLSGEDEEVLSNYLEKEYGLTQNTIDHVEVGKILRGKVIDSGSVGYGLYVDLGINQPEEIDALVPLHELRVQLAKGRKTSLREIIHAFCLFDNLTLEVVPTVVDLDKSIIEACLSDSQLSVLTDWEETNLERILVMGAARSQVRDSLVRTGHKRDVLRIEDMGLLESLVICKLGTHAKGLIPRLGRLLRGVSFHIFLPRVAREVYRKS
jgi:hypothetical protein